MSILIRPIISEKMTRTSEKMPRYGFFVEVEANKIEIKNAVEAMYNVNVEDVNTMIHNGKRKIRYTKAGFSSGRTPRLKKAYVTLKQGETIDFYSSI
jgi:large subunit ribosomal protein L23